jgi:predicted ester cyclase
MEMGPQEMKDAVRRFVTGIFDEGNFALLNEMTTEGYTFTIPRPGRISGEAFVGVVTEFRSAFSVIRNSYEEQVAEGNVVVTRGTTHVTQPAPTDDPDATGKTASVPWVIFTRFDGERISEQWEVWDELGLMYELGAIPKPD